MLFSMEFQAMTPPTLPPSVNSTRVVASSSVIDAMNSSSAIGRQLSLADEAPYFLDEPLPGRRRYVELEPVPFPVETDLWICGAAADPRLEDETVAFAIGNAPVLSGAGMVGRKHEERDGSLLSFELRIHSCPVSLIAAPGTTPSRCVSCRPDSREAGAHSFAPRQRGGSRKGRTCAWLSLREAEGPPRSTRSHRRQMNSTMMLRMRIPGEKLQSSPLVTIIDRKRRRRFGASESASPAGSGTSARGRKDDYDRSRDRCGTCACHGTARSLRDQLRKLDGVESVDLAREAAGHDAGAKSEGEMLVLATVVLELLPVGAQAAIDWLVEYVRRPGTSPVRVKVKLESGASAEARFDPKVMDGDGVRPYCRGTQVGAGALGARIDARAGAQDCPTHRQR